MQSLDGKHMVKKRRVWTEIKKNGIVTKKEIQTIYPRQTTFVQSHLCSDCIQVCGCDSESNTIIYEWFKDFKTKH